MEAVKTVPLLESEIGLGQGTGLRTSAKLLITP